MVVHGLIRLLRVVACVQPWITTRGVVIVVVLAAASGNRIYLRFKCAKIVTIFTRPLTIVIRRGVEAELVVVVVVRS